MEGGVDAPSDLHEPIARARQIAVGIVEDVEQGRTRPPEERSLDVHYRVVVRTASHSRSKVEGAVTSDDRGPSGATAARRRG
jgi:hypothetical protein